LLGGSKHRAVVRGSDIPTHPNPVYAAPLPEEHSLDYDYVGANMGSTETSLTTGTV